MISRFVNREFRLVDRRGRDDYLRRLGRGMMTVDWSVLTWAAMSSHLHVAARAGTMPATSWLKPLHTGLAGMLNRTQGRLGPVFAERPRTIGLRDEDALRLVRYIHNNPVRAGVVRDPADSDWTAHRAFIGDVAAPPWLDVDAVLSLCGFDASPSGRLAFHDHVRSHASDGRDGELSGDHLRALRARIRAALGNSAEVTHLMPPTDHGTRGEVGIWLPAGAAVRWPLEVAPGELLDRVCEQLQLPRRQLQSGTRVREVTAARRVYLLAGTALGMAAHDLAPLVSISGSAASHLLRDRPERVNACLPAVEAIVKGMEAEVGSG